MPGDGGPASDGGTELEAESETETGPEAEAPYRRLSVGGRGGGPDPERVRRLLDEAAGDAPVAFDVLEAAPGESVPSASHDGTGVEELLFVLAGELLIETGGEAVHVGANEAVVVPPDPPERPVAVGDDSCRYLAFGAP